MKTVIISCGDTAVMFDDAYWVIDEYLHLWIYNNKKDVLATFAKWDSVVFQAPNVYRG